MVDRVEARIRTFAPGEDAAVSGSVRRGTVMQTANRRTTWILVAIFAVAMAWVEAAVVYDLRVLVDRLEPYQPNPLPISGALGNIELAREVATLVMLATVGALAGVTLRTRLAYAAIAFGVWDIFYYLFLKVMYGWPRSPFDWDILFLLPLPWWGPVIAPVSIAVLMLAWGTLRDRVIRCIDAQSPRVPALAGGGTRRRACAVRVHGRRAARRAARDSRR